MALINDGRNRFCKDNVGGVEKVVYLFKHVRYSRSQVLLNNNILVSYPTTTVYPFYIDNEVSISQAQAEQEGGKYFDFSVNLELQKELGINYEKYLNFDINIIVKDRNGNFRFLGNRNGLTCESVDYSIGTTKQDFTGVKLQFTGQEEKEAWYINDLNGAGFVIDGETPSLDNAFLLQNNDFFLLQNNDNLIMQNG